MILVTGATGHIGNVLVRELLAQGERVRVLVLQGEDCSSLDGLNVQRVQGNILNPDSLRPAFWGVKTVYHLAGIISIMPGQDELVQRVNVQGTRNVVNAARQAKVKRLVYTSSIHAITRPPAGVVIDETLPFDPHNPWGAYDRSKALASLAVQEAVKEGLDAVIVCPTGVIGPFDFRSSEMGTLILSWMKRGFHLLIDGAYDWVDVRDVACGMILACKKGRTGETYILSGERVGIPRLLEWVQEITGIHAPKINVPLNIAGFFAPIAAVWYRLTRTKPHFTPYAVETVQSNSFISNAKAVRELGYQTRSLRHTVADTIAWWREFLHKKTSSPRKA
jgi:dihydroflavonol-4-reductase